MAKRGRKVGKKHKGTKVIPAHLMSKKSLRKKGRKKA